MPRRELGEMGEGLVAERERIAVHAVDEEDEEVSGEVEPCGGGPEKAWTHAPERWGEEREGRGKRGTRPR